MQTLGLGSLLVFQVFKTAKGSLTKTKKRLLCFDVEEKVLLKKERTKVLSVFPFSSILSYQSDSESSTVTVEFVKQARNGMETRRSIYIAQNRYEKNVLVTVLHSIIHNDWTYIFATIKIPLEEINKPPPGLSTRIVGRGHLLMRGSKSNFESVLVTVAWGKLFVQSPIGKRSGGGGVLRSRATSQDAASGINLHSERAFSLVNGSLAVDVDGSGRIDVVTPTHRLQFLVEVKSELSHDKWLKVLAQSIAVYDSANKYFIDFGEMVRSQSKGGSASQSGASNAAARAAALRARQAGLPSLSSPIRNRNGSTDTVPYVRASGNAEIMLAKHFLLNFTVVFLPPKNTKLNINAKDRNMMGQCRAMLHVDNLRKTLEMWMKGTCVLSFKLRAVNAFEVSEEEAFPSLSVEYKGNRNSANEVETHKIVLHFQAPHKVELCRVVLSNTVRPQSPNEPLGLQRSILKQGNIHKKGKSGLYGQRYGVLVPNKLLLLRSKTAYIPLQVITFGSVMREWTIDLDDQDRTVVNLAPQIASGRRNSACLQREIGALMNQHISLKFEDTDEAMDWYNHLLKQAKASVHVPMKRSPPQAQKQEREERRGGGDDDDDDDDGATRTSVVNPVVQEAMAMDKPEASPAAAEEEEQEEEEEEGVALAVDAGRVGGMASDAEAEAAGDGETELETTRRRISTSSMPEEEEGGGEGAETELERTWRRISTSSRQTDDEEEEEEEEVGEGERGRPAAGEAEKAGADEEASSVVKDAFRFWGVEKKK